MEIKRGVPVPGPILIVEDDLDDQELLREVFEELKIPNFIRFFKTCIAMLEYLMTTIEKPFLIISDVNLPMMSGLELRKEIYNNELLRKKNIPFIIFTTSMDRKTIAQANDMMIQGYFVKPPSIGETKDMMKMIIEYWKYSKHGWH